MNQFEYFLTLRPANEELSINFENEEHKKVLQKACPANLTILEFGHNIIKVKLTSSSELKVPGRALRSFSKRLVENPIFQSMLWHGHLFKTSPSCASDKQNPANTVANITSTISDTVFMQSLLAYFLNNKSSNSSEYRHRKDAIEQMKSIGLSVGIIPEK